MAAGLQSTLSQSLNTDYANAALLMYKLRMKHNLCALKDWMRRSLPASNDVLRWSSPYSPKCTRNRLEPILLHLLQKDIMMLRQTLIIASGLTSDCAPSPN